jgi:hypothetical protein
LGPATVFWKELKGKVVVRMVLPGKEREGVEGVGKGGGEMTQTLYAHMNKIKLN